MIATIQDLARTDGFHVTQRVPLESSECPVCGRGSDCLAYSIGDSLTPDYLACGICRRALASTKDAERAYVVRLATLYGASVPESRALLGADVGIRFLYLVALRLRGRMHGTKRDREAMAIAERYADPWTMIRDEFGAFLTSAQFVVVSALALWPTRVDRATQQWYLSYLLASIKEGRKA